jgi:hypothetical protein
VTVKNKKITFNPNQEAVHVKTKEKKTEIYQTEKSKKIHKYYSSQIYAKIISLVVRIFIFIRGNE